jgi:hypothetical protein
VLQRGQVLAHGLGVPLEVLIGHVATLAKGEDGFGLVAVFDDPERGCRRSLRREA